MEFWKEPGYLMRLEIIIIVGDETAGGYFLKGIFLRHILKSTWMTLYLLKTCFKNSVGGASGQGYRWNQFRNCWNWVMNAWWSLYILFTASESQLSSSPAWCLIYLPLLPLVEKATAPHSSVLAWRIPGTEEPSGLLSMGSHRLGHDWSDLAAAAASFSKVSNHCLLFLASQISYYWIFLQILRAYADFCICK